MHLTLVKSIVYKLYLNKSILKKDLGIHDTPNASISDINEYMYSKIPQLSNCCHQPCTQMLLIKFLVLAQYIASQSLE